MGVWYDRQYDVPSQSWRMVPVPTPIAITPDGKLRIEIIPRTLSAGDLPNRMPIDANSYNVAGALTDDSNLTLTPLSVDVIIDVPAVRIDATLITQ